MDPPGVHGRMRRGERAVATAHGQPRVIGFASKKWCCNMYGTYGYDGAVCVVTNRGLNLQTRGPRERVAPRQPWPQFNGGVVSP